MGQKLRIKGGGVWKRHADQIMKDLCHRGEQPQEPQGEEEKPSQDKKEAGSQHDREVGKESFQPQKGPGTASNSKKEGEDRANLRETETVPEGKQAEGEVEEETESSPARRTKSGRAVKRPNRYTDN